MTVARRLARLEGTLGPREAVLAWLSDAQRFDGLPDLARSIIDTPTADTPLSRICAQTESGVRGAMRAESYEVVERAVRRSVGDAIFLYVLVIRLNLSTMEFANVEALRAGGLFFQMAAMRADPEMFGDRTLTGAPDGGGGAVSAWQLWRRATDFLCSAVEIEEQARAAIQVIYLDGREALFSDTTKAWTELRAQVDGLAKLAVLRPRKRARTRRGERDSADAPAGTLEERVQERARELADDARIKTFELLGERDRAVAIMERRLRRESAWSEAGSSAPSEPTL